MIFTGPHWWAGLLQIGVLAAELLVLLLFLRRHNKICGVVLWVIGAYFLVYKLWEYISNRKWPIDFSALTYFLFGIAALLPFRPLKTAASFSGFIAGSIFIVSFILFPEFHNQQNPVFYYRAMGFVNHNLMFTGSFLLMIRYRFKKSDIAFIVGWLIFVVAYSEIMIYGFHVVDTVEVITKIVDGSIVFNLFSEGKPTWWFLIIYYLVCIGILVAFIWLLYRLNSVFYNLSGEADIQ